MKAAGGIHSAWFFCAKKEGCNLLDGKTKPLY